MFNPTRLIFSTLLGLCIFGGAYAATVGSTLNVSTNVLGICSVSTLPVVVADYDSSATTQGTGSVDVTCSTGVAYNIALDGGVNYTVPGGGGGRHMSDGSAINYLIYSLWQDDTFGAMWGDSDFAATNTWLSVAGVGTGAVQAYPVPAAVPIGQILPAGAYSDVVNVTIHY